MIRFLIDISKETIPIFLQLKHYIDQAMELPYFKTISALGACATIGIFLIKKSKNPKNWF